VESGALVVSLLLVMIRKKKKRKKTHTPYPKRRFSRRLGVAEFVGVEGAWGATEGPCVGMERGCMGMGSWVGCREDSGRERGCVHMGELGRGVERASAVAKWVGDARIVSKRTMRKEKKNIL
jgi:hypothetical protein